MKLEQIMQANEAAIDKWSQPPKFSSPIGLVDRLKLLHDTKRFFIIQELKKLRCTKGGTLRVLDFGAGHGGITIDVKTYFGDSISMVGYDVSPKAVEIAKKAARRLNAHVEFIADSNCNLKRAVGGVFDAVISCDTFGHVPSVPQAFEAIHSILTQGGKLIAFSETSTGEALIIARYLARKGFSMDGSEKEHISLHSVHELKQFLFSAHFTAVEVYPYDPIRFAFYPKRYLRKIRRCNRPLFVLATCLSLFQNRITEIAYNQINLALAKRVPLHDTAGCCSPPRSPRSSVKDQYWEGTARRSLCVADITL